jgi:hypothetical protein
LDVIVEVLPGTRPLVRFSPAAEASEDAAGPAMAYRFSGWSLCTSPAVAFDSAASTSGMCRFAHEKKLANPKLGAKQTRRQDREAALAAKIKAQIAAMSRSMRTPVAVSAL